jgi:N-acetylmuramoyl-L-alanine amidase
VDVIGSFDESGLRESDFGIYAAGTFRIEGEADEGKQPMFNLATIDCEKQLDDTGKASLECKVMQAVVWATSDKPNTDNPNCSLDLVWSAYSMKELQKGVLTGIVNSSACYNTMLTIDRNVADKPGPSRACARHGVLVVGEEMKGLVNAKYGRIAPLVDRERGIYDASDNIAVLYESRMPALLLEAGMIVNRAEEQVLSSATHRATVARAVATAAERFCGVRAPQT